MIPPPPFLQFMIRARIWALLGEPDLEAKGWGCNFLVLCKKMTLKLAHWAQGAFSPHLGPTVWWPKNVGSSSASKVPQGCPQALGLAAGTNFGHSEVVYPTKKRHRGAIFAGAAPRTPISPTQTSKKFPGAAPRTPPKSVHMPARPVGSRPPLHRRRDAAPARPRRGTASVAGVFHEGIQEAVQHGAGIQRRT